MKPYYEDGRAPCGACSACTLQRGHIEAHNCDCADRWVPPSPPEDWAEKAEAGRAAWAALSACEREQLLLEARFGPSDDHQRAQEAP